MPLSYKDVFDNRKMRFYMQKEDGAWIEITGIGDVTFQVERFEWGADNPQMIVNLLPGTSFSVLGKGDVPPANDDKAWEKFVLEGVQ